MTTPELQALLALQDLDTRTDQERHHKAHLPQRAELAEMDRLASERTAARAGVAAALQEIVTRQEAAERELAATEGRIRHVNDRLYGGTVSASRELQAMAAEVEALGKRVSELEDRVLGLMDERQPLDDELDRLDRDLVDIAGRREGVEASLRAAEAEVGSVLADLEAARAGRLAPVPPSLVVAYEKLRSRLGGVAVARLVGGRCDGCHLSLPAVELDRIRHQPSGTLEHCEQCGRILVIAEPG